MGAGTALCVPFRLFMCVCLRLYLGIGEGAGARLVVGR